MLWFRKFASAVCLQFCLMQAVVCIRRCWSACTCGKDATWVETATYIRATCYFILSLEIFAFFFRHNLEPIRRFILGERLNYEKL